MEKTTTKETWLFKNNVGFIGEHYFYFDQLKHWEYLHYSEIESIFAKKQRHILSWVVWSLLLVLCVLALYYRSLETPFLLLMPLMFIVFLTFVFFRFPLYQYQIIILKKQGTLIKETIPRGDFYQYLQIIKLLQTILKSSNQVASSVILKVD